MVLSLLILYRLEHSPLGFKWKAIRDADNLALSVGINVMWYKIINFAIASFFAGVAGADRISDVADVLTKVAGVDVKEARRRIADKLIEDNQYKF